jgi:arylsulfatase
MVDRTFRITAHLRNVGAKPSGVIVSLGDLSGGFVLYVQEGAIAFDYNCEGTVYGIRSDVNVVDASSRTIDIAFTRGEQLSARVEARVDGRPAASGEIPRTARWFISWSPLDVGRDSLSRVSDAYSDAFPFTTSALDHVDIELGPNESAYVHHPVD